jgi:GNAT superfamily N-acetyltransferase
MYSERSSVGKSALHAHPFAMTSISAPSTDPTVIEAARLAELGITAVSWADDMRRKVLVGYVARRGGQMVGYCFGDSRTGEVVVLALLPDAEGKGVGRALLGRVVEALAQAGHARLFLGCSSDPRARSYGFYRHLGWRPTGQQDSLGDEMLELQVP